MRARGRRGLMGFLKGRGEKFSGVGRGEGKCKFDDGGGEEGGKIELGCIY